jgi:hypothetical protein
MGNYPNPFKHETRIEFTLEKDADVELILMNSLGQTVKILLMQQANKGEHSIILNGSDLEPGIYFIRLKVDGNSQTRKCIFTK